MVKSRSLLGFDGNTDSVTVDRALAEFRAGRPVLIRAGDESALAISAEIIDDAFLARISDFADGNARLILPAARLRRLGHRSPALEQRLAKLEAFDRPAEGIGAAAAGTVGITAGGVFGRDGGRKCRAQFGAVLWQVKDKLVQAEGQVKT